MNNELAICINKLVVVYTIHDIAIVIYHKYRFI